MDRLVQKIFEDTIEHITLGIVFGIHRQIKFGILTHESLNYAELKYKNRSYSRNPKIPTTSYDEIKSIQCVCPNCNRSIAACRFAPHLEKCLGMGRNSSRLASKKIKKSIYLENMNSDEGDLDNNVIKTEFTNDYFGTDNNSINSANYVECIPPPIATTISNDSNSHKKNGSKSKKTCKEKKSKNNADTLILHDELHKTVGDKEATIVSIGIGTINLHNYLYTTRNAMNDSIESPAINSITNRSLNNLLTEPDSLQARRCTRRNAQQQNQFLWSTSTKSNEVKDSITIIDNYTILNLSKDPLTPGCILVLKASYITKMTPQNVQLNNTLVDVHQTTSATSFLRRRYSTSLGPSTTKPSRWLAQVVPDSMLLSSAETEQQQTAGPSKQHQQLHKRSAQTRTNTTQYVTVKWLDIIMKPSTPEDVKQRPPTISPIFSDYSFNDNFSSTAIHTSTTHVYKFVDYDQLLVANENADNTITGKTIEKIKTNPPTNSLKNKTNYLSNKHDSTVKEQYQIIDIDAIALAIKFRHSIDDNLDKVVNDAFISERALQSFKSASLSS